MQQKHTFWWQRGIMLLAMILAFGDVSVAQAQALQVTVRVLIQETSWGNCDDGFFGGPPEIYFKVRIGGIEFSTEASPIESNFSPFQVNRAFNLDVAFSNTPIAIAIEQWDDDGFLTFDDDQCDLKPGPGQTLNMNLNLQTCQVTGDVTGACGPTIDPRGPARIKFTVNVEEPPRTAGLNTRCLHNPIWPQPGNTVTFTAQALDGNGNLITTQPVDNIEIWINNTVAPAATSATTPGSAGVSVFTTTFVPPTGATDILYRCRVTDAGQTVSSGWRRVQIGLPPSGRAVPVIFTQFRRNAVDVVFIPNIGDATGNDFTGPNDPNFLTAVSNIINNGYYSELVFLGRQDTLNFWIAQDTASVNSTDTSGCTFTTPNNWNSQYSFADTGAILYRNPPGGGCARRERRLFASPPGALRVVLHESGHSPFGLSDEYSNGMTAYFEPDPFPNIYDTVEECRTDAVNLGRVASSCRSFMSASGATWFTSEPPSNDLMNDNRTPQQADIRRIDWLFDNCDAAQC